MPVRGEPPGPRRQARRRFEMAQDRSAGRRHPLALDAVVDHGKALQQQRRRRCRHRQGAVAARDAAAADSAAVRSTSSAPSASITKAAPTMSAIESQSASSWKCTCSIGRPCTLASASARWPGSPARAPPRQARAAPRRCGARISTYMPCGACSPAAGGSIATRLPLSAPSRCAQVADLPVVGQTGRAHRGEGALGELRPGVERGSQKHVAGQAAQRIEVDVGRAHAPAQASGRCTGTTYGPSGITATRRSPERATLACTASAARCDHATPVSACCASGRPPV